MKWLEDRELLELSQRTPRTQWGKELMRDAWPKRFTGMVSSDTYRGYASVLAEVYRKIYVGAELQHVENIITRVDEDSKLLADQEQSDLAGGARLAIVNSWSNTHCGLTIQKAIDAFESELIYTAKMFVTASQLEASGHLP
jgi:hypothetical protein